MEAKPPGLADAARMVAVPLGELFAIASGAEQAGRIDEAERLLSHLLAAAPGQAEVLHLAGIVAYRRGRMQDAVALMERAVERGIDIAMCLRNLCEVYRRIGRLDDALEAGQRAVRLAPSDPFCQHNLAILHLERLELDAAMACARRALEMRPDMAGAHFLLAECMLLRGEMAPGWEEYEWRFRVMPAQMPVPSSGRPQWDGLPRRHGTLLVAADQGLGDAIQFSRYLPWVAERCRDMVVACRNELRPLLHQIVPGLRIFSDWAQCPAFDAHITLSGLPRLHRTRLETIPAPVPYLHADPMRAAAWHARLAQLLPTGYRRIGIIWAGRPDHNNDHNRSTTLASFTKLSEVPGVALISLQKGTTVPQASAYFGPAPLLNIGPEIADFDDTMAILACLDLLVTVDTSIGHLAGAMGRPVWIMLPRSPDWRWLLDRADTPWYPTARLFRQDTDRSYASVIARIAARLREDIASADLPHARNRLS